MKTVVIKSKEYDVEKTLELTLWECVDTDLVEIGKLVNLKELKLFISKDISALSPLANLTKLEVLSLPQGNFSNISPLALLTNLTSLSFEKNSISDLSPLANLNNFKSYCLTYIGDE